MVSGGSATASSCTPRPQTTGRLPTSNSLPIFTLTPPDDDITIVDKGKGKSPDKGKGKSRADTIDNVYQSHNMAKKFGIIRQLQDIHGALSWLYPDIGPGDEVNKLFGRLVRVCIRPYELSVTLDILGDQRVQKLIPDLRKFGMVGETKLEAFWAKKLSLSDGPELITKEEKEGEAEDQRAGMSYIHPVLLPAGEG